MNIGKLSSIALVVFFILSTATKLSKNEAMVCVKNSGLSDVSNSCIYRGLSGKRGEKGDLGKVDRSEVTSLQSEFKLFVLERQ